jgi:hypothetical protein
LLLTDNFNSAFNIKKKHPYNFLFVLNGQVNT